MNMKAVIASEASKRRERMYDARSKGAFQIQSRQVYRNGGKTLTVWELWSSHTHRRSPRCYTVTRVQENGKTPHWGCTCPDFEANGAWFPCKHILYVQSREEV
ncbi:MAG: hypothetical protein KatS3mg046_801 [Bellilinea sp.]|nr:MAG: hypothetical protein KatS3mg046_801 [Bellilinea sp.]